MDPKNFRASATPAMETAIFTPILTSLTWIKSKINVNYKSVRLLPHFRILQLQYYILRQNYNKNVKEIKIAYGVEM